MESRREEIIKIAFLIIFSSFLIFFKLGEMDIASSNEGQRAVPPIEMLNSSDYLIPTINGDLYLAKPPLIYWMIAASYKLTGTINNFTARLPSAICGVIFILVFYFVNKQFFDKNISFLSSLLLITNPYFLTKIRKCELDFPLTLALFIAIYFLYKICYEKDKRVYIYSFLSGLFLGISTLLKGPVPLLFYLTAIISLLVIDKNNFKKLFSFKSLIILIAFLITAIPWYLLVIKRIGTEESWNIFSNQALRRVYRSSDINSGSILFYLLRVPLTMAPWGFLLPLTLSPRYLKRNQDSNHIKFIFFFFYISLIILSFIRGKEIEYALPIIPFGMMLINPIIGEFLNNKLINWQKIYIKIWFWIIISALPIAFFYLIMMYKNNLNPFNQPLIKIFSLFAVFLLSLFAITNFIKNKFSNSLFFMIGIITFFSPFHTIIEIKDKNKNQSLRIIGESARKLIDKNYTVEVFEEDRPQLIFYIRRRINENHQLEDVKNKLNQLNPYFVIIRDNKYKKLKGLLQNKETYIWTGPVSERKFIIVSNIKKTD